MDMPLFSDAVSSFPLLLWDSAFPTDLLTDGRPYRNIGELLVKRSPAVREALQLCGCDAAVIEGTASDYEAFAALCTAIPMLTGHPVALAIETLLRFVFGDDYALSPYQTDDLWATLNDAIEATNLRPADIVAALNVESLCYRHGPLTPIPKETAMGCDVYPIWDLNDMIETARHSLFDHISIQDVVCRWTASLPDFLASGCVSARIALPRRYRFRRNSRKREVDESLQRLCQNEALSDDELNALATALILAVSDVLKSQGLVLLLETEADPEELIRLFDYLALNDILPETVLITVQPQSYLPLFRRFTQRTEKGLPSLVAVSDDITDTLKAFPIGPALLPCGAVTDVVMLADSFRRRNQLLQHLESLDGDPETLSSLAEDVVYGNIKNRFGI